MMDMMSRLVLPILILSLVAPMATGHGANDFAIILRGSSMQPGEAEVLQNDSLTFYNVADENRTIRVDLDSDGTYDQRCETESYNSSSVKDECSFIIDANTWSAGFYFLDVFSNGTLWKTLNLTVANDVHEEAGPPEGYSFNTENESSDDEDDERRVSSEGLGNIAIVIFLSSGAVWLARRN